MNIEMHIRSQKSRGSGANTFGGPDTCVAVTYTPDDQVCPRYLNRKVLAMRGIKIINCGEGYSEHRGPRSMLGQAIAEAERLVDEAMDREDKLVASA